MNTFFTITIRWFQLLLIILIVVLISTLTGYFSSKAEQFFPTMMMLISISMLFFLVAMLCGFVLREKWVVLNYFFKTLLLVGYCIIFIAPTLYYSLKMLYETFL